VPPTKPYELSALAVDLVVLARYLLKPGGRLVFFLPTVIDEYKELDLDSLLCDGMQVVANSLQDFGAWGRRVRVHLGRNTCRRSLLPLLLDRRHGPSHS
jgi:tRNA (guanine10-N2)-methyltransferase